MSRLPNNPALSKARKGFAGEDLLVTLFVVILVVVFVIASISIYSKYLDDKSFLETQRAASVLAEKLYFENNGIIKNPEAVAGYINRTGIRVAITDAERNLTWASGSTDTNAKKIASSSAAVLIEAADKRLYPGRIEVLVSA